MHNKCLFWCGRKKNLREKTVKRGHQGTSQCAVQSIDAALQDGDIVCVNMIVLYLTEKVFLRGHRLWASFYMQTG